MHITLQFNSCLTCCADHGNKRVSEILWTPTSTFQWLFWHIS